MKAEAVTPRHIVHLTDDELVLLDGGCSEKVQAEVDSAKRRLAARVDDLTPRQSDLIVAMLEAVEDGGALRWQRKPITTCSICGRDDGYRLFKSGQRRGEPDYRNRKTFPGIDMDDSFVTIQHHARLGGCAECMIDLLPHLRSALAGVPVEAPAALLGDDALRWKKHHNRECGACGWTGHEGQMIQERTMLGDGWYPARCPECNAGSGFNRTVKTVPGFVLLPAEATR